MGTIGTSSEAEAGGSVVGDRGLRPVRQLHGEGVPGDQAELVQAARHPLARLVQLGQRRVPGRVGEELRRPVAVASGFEELREGDAAMVAFRPPALLPLGSRGAHGRGSTDLGSPGMA